VDGEWSDSERIEDYLKREIPFRDEAERIALEAAPQVVDAALDLGSGDGRLAQLVVENWPGAEVLAVDNSIPMLARARARFADAPNVRVEAHDLENRLPAFGPINLAVSGLAIHHLADRRKQALFGEVYSLLRPGGAFINLDLFSSPSQRAHERFRELIGRREEDPADRLCALDDELRFLRDAGFVRVDCWLKWRELGLVVGYRPE